MKTTIKILFAVLLLINCQTIKAQKTSKSSLAVVSIDTKNLNLDPISMASLVRTELEKLDTFNVIDKYDVQQFMEQSKISMANCFGKSCLTELGIQLKAQRMFTGSAELIGKNITITFRLLNVESGEIEKTYVREFLSIPEEIQSMVKVSVSEMFSKPFDKNLMTKLAKKYAFDNSFNNPTVERLALDGPRMGFMGFTGKDLGIIQGKKSEGGFDLYPVMFQFGYQFEKQYLNEGNVQALFEFIPMITGLDQGFFIPSVSILHGLRSNINGWEFAFGPSFNIGRSAAGYYDSNGHWQLKEQWGKNPENIGKSNPNEIVNRMDSRGDYKFQSYFVLGCGRTFKSGKLNIPVNIYVIPGRDGWRYGVSFGFNAKRNN